MARDFGSGLRRSRLTPYCNAEGALFRDVLLRAARACELRLVEILGRMLGEQAEAALADGQVVVIYPEGTVTDSPDSLPMQGKTGVVRLSLASGAGF